MTTKPVEFSRVCLCDWQVGDSAECDAEKSAMVDRIQDLEAQCAAMREALGKVETEDCQCDPDNGRSDHDDDCVIVLARNALSSNAGKDFEARIREETERAFDANAGAIRHWALIEGFKEGVEACAKLVESYRTAFYEKQGIVIDIRNLKREVKT